MKALLGRGFVYLLKVVQLVAVSLLVYSVSVTGYSGSTIALSVLLLVTLFPWGWEENRASRE